MTIHLPKDLETSIEAAVHGGRFASVDEFVAQAVRSFLHQGLPPKADAGLGSIGAMSDDADLLDEITQDIMESRRNRTLRLTPDA